MPTLRKRTVAVVGAGPVGVLTALYFSNRAWTVKVYDIRSDPTEEKDEEVNTLATPTKPNIDGGRSINLAVSSRGFEGMRGVDPALVDTVLAHSVPMRGRMLHILKTKPISQEHEDKGQYQKIPVTENSPVDKTNPKKETQITVDAVSHQPGSSVNGILSDPTNLGLLPENYNTSLISQDYGLHGECIYSVERKKLNSILIEDAKSRDNVTFVFEHRLKRCDFDNKKIIFEPVQKPGAEIIEENVDLVIGADGAYSAVRGQLNRRVRMDFHQEYIDHAYCEFTIPARKEKSEVNKGEYEYSYAMDRNHLHIWPRQSFMMIALANTDKSFTNTLFMPWSEFEKIHTPSQCISFFKQHFPDAVPLMGEQQIVRDFFNNPKGSLMSVKTYPYHYTSRCLLIGDAAHAMVPFYGQGMNAGFEDVRVLNEILNEFDADDTDDQLAKALEAYTQRRHDDLLSICDLAMHNYQEMRSDVVSISYVLRRRIEGVLHRLFPSKVVPLYTMVAFRPEIRYREALDRWKAQGRVIGLGVTVTGLAAAAALLISGLTWYRHK